ADAQASGGLCWTVESQIRRLKNSELRTHLIGIRSDHARHAAVFGVLHLLEAEGGIHRSGHGNACVQLEREARRVTLAESWIVAVPEMPVFEDRRDVHRWVDDV